MSKKKGILLFEEEYSPTLEKTYTWSWTMAKQKHQYYETWLPKKRDIMFHTQLTKEEKKILCEELFHTMKDELLQTRALVNSKRKASRQKKAAISNRLQ